MFLVAAFSFTEKTVVSQHESYGKAMDAAANFNAAVYNHVVVYREVGEGRYQPIATIYTH